MTIALGEDGQPIWGNRQANAARKRSYRERLAAEERKAAQLLDEVAASALATLALRQHADMRTLLEREIAVRQATGADQRGAVERLAELVRTLAP
jgi:hypothetical protein